MIDTASNYRSGRGERAVGFALTALQGKLGLTREMLFVSTKAGFLQDQVKSQVCHLTHKAFFVFSLLLPARLTAFLDMTGNVANGNTGT